MARPRGMTPRGLLLAAAALLSACAPLPPPPGEAPQTRAPAIGRLLDYVRSNRDGTMPERIVVFRRTATAIEVYKSVRRCANAAFVTAELDPADFEPRRLVAGRVARDGTQQAFGEMALDPATRRLEARVTTPGGTLADSVHVPDRPWHLYDFDLASLTVALQHVAQPERDFSFGLALILVSPATPDRFFAYLGRADARFVRREPRGGAATLRFEVGGPAFGARGGPLWIDAAAGHIVEAEWGVPNHDGYDDFRLRLVRTSDGGLAEWDEMLRDHWRGCGG